jgi:hypothetical protein
VGGDVHFACHHCVAPVGVFALPRYVVERTGEALGVGGAPVSDPYERLSHYISPLLE